MKTIVLPDGRKFCVPTNHNRMAMDMHGDWWTFDASHCRFVRLHDLKGAFEPGNWALQQYDISTATPKRLF